MTSEVLMMATVCGLAKVLEVDPVKLTESIQSELMHQDYVNRLIKAKEKLGR